MEDDELQEDLLDTDGDNEDSADESGSAPPQTESKPEDESKRVNDLMGKCQAEQARANKLEAQLKAADSGDEGTQGNESDADLESFKDFARENARITLFNSDPRLVEYGLAPEDIAGSTLEQMQASVKKHQKLVGGIEGRARNKILAEHGLDPEVATGASSEKAPTFSTMSDKEFSEVLAQRDSRR